MAAFTTTTYKELLEQSLATLETRYGLEAPFESAQFVIHKYSPGATVPARETDPYNGYVLKLFTPIPASRRAQQFPMLSIELGMLYKASPKKKLESFVKEISKAFGKHVTEFTRDEKSFAQFAQFCEEQGLKN